MNEGTEMNRRKFMGTSLAAAAGLALNINRTSLSARRKKSNMKLGLYTITFLGAWYLGEALSLEEVIKRAKKYGYEGIEIAGKRPHGNPLDWPKRRCKALRAVANGEGIDIYGVAANNNFSSPVPEYRECEIAYVKELIRMTSDLGARTLRVFLGWPGVTVHDRLTKYSIARDNWKYVHQKFTEEEIWAWCRESMVECAGYAKDAGITLALQNHRPVIRDYRDVLRMVKEVDSAVLKVSLDAPIMADKSPENIRRAARAVADLQVLSHFGGEYDRDENGKVKGASFYKHFVQAMHDIGYSGYLGYELCHPLPVVNGRTVGIEYPEKNAQLAAEFMRGVISEVTRG